MDDAIRQVLNIFQDELRENSLAITDALIQIERADAAGRKTLMKEVFRHAHTVKGNAGSFGLQDLEELAHAIETALTPFRDGQKKPTPGIIPTVLEALDRGAKRVAQAMAGNDEPDPVIQSLAAKLLNPAAAATPNPPPSAPPPVEKPKQEEVRTKEETTGVHRRRAEDEGTGEVSGVQPGGGGQGAQTEFIRVSMARLGALDRQLDDLREVRSALEHHSESARRLYWGLEATLASQVDETVRDFVKSLRDQVQVLFRGMSNDVGELSSKLSEADDELRGLRMIPVRGILAPLKRSIWEHAHSAGKQGRFEMSGADVALDRKLLEELKDPLMHLARNAVDHGLETPEERKRAGKPAEGLIWVVVEQRGSTVFITFADDGRGVDVVKVRARAIERGVLSSEDAAKLTEDGVRELLFSSGFSMAQSLSKTSGRGVGLDVVRENIGRLGGKVSIRSTLGKGTQFLVEIPLTLATTQALLVEAAGTVLALPIVSVTASTYLMSDGAKAASKVDLNGQILQIHSFADVLGLQGADASKSNFPVIVLSDAGRKIAFRVDRLLGEREVVVRPIPPELTAVPHLTAAAALGDGRLVFILNAKALLEAAGGVTPEARAEKISAKKRIVVADDSITTRSLHKQVLESAGFSVRTASSGEDAFRILISEGADLVVSDVNMPRLDGLGLTRKIRKERRLSALPIILVSSLDSEHDRKNAEEAGASAYVTKQEYQKGELLRLVKGFLFL